MGANSKPVARGAKMRILIADWAHLDAVLPVVKTYQVGIEIQEYTSPDNLDQPRSMATDIREKIQSIPWRGFHGPFYELVPASRDARVREVARSRFQEAYALAQTMQVQHFVLHTGYFPKTYPRAVWIQNSLEFWVDFLRDKRAGIALHLENVYEDDYAPVAELLDGINEALRAEVVTACLDIGHVNSNSSKTLEEWITGLGGRIGYVHLHNNDGILDDHWELGKGKINMVWVLDLLSRHAPAALWTIETRVSGIEPSVFWLKEKGFL